MPENWKDINEDEILDYEEAHTGKMHRYDRIMSRKMRDSIKEASETMFAASGNIGGSVDKAKHVLKDAIDRMNERMDRMIASSNKAFVMSIIFSVIMAFLTGAIAFSAVVQLISK